MNPLITCPSCEGYKFITVFLDKNAVSQARPIPCDRCQGKGKVSAECYEWIEQGKLLRQDRRRRDMSLGQEADRRKMDIITLSQMELGIIKPVFPESKIIIKHPEVKHPEQVSKTIWLSNITTNKTEVPQENFKEKPPKQSDYIRSLEKKHRRSKKVHEKLRKAVEMMKAAYQDRIKDCKDTIEMLAKVIEKPAVTPPAPEENKRPDYQWSKTELEDRWRLKDQPALKGWMSTIYSTSFSIYGDQKVKYWESEVTDHSNGLLFTRKILCGQSLQECMKLTKEYINKQLGL